MSIALVINLRSRANRHDPATATRLKAVLGEDGRVIAAASLEELAAAAADLARTPPDAIAIHGGDGTLHKSLTALVRAWGDRPLPTIAILPGGTMNVVAASLGLARPPEQIIGALRTALHGGQPVPTLDRRCLRVADDYGFVFGSGLMANFLEAYYSKKTYGARRALWLLFRTFFSALVGGSYAHHISQRIEGTVKVDGQALPWHSLTGIGAATVREVGLGFKLNHRADDDPQRFGVLAIHSGTAALSKDLWAVRRGRGIAPSRAWSAVASSLKIEPQAAQTLYTIDGDLYTAVGPIEVALGPKLRFFKPA